MVVSRQPTNADLSSDRLQFIMRKRQTRFNYGERCRPVSLDAYSLDSVSAYNSVRRKGAARASKRSYGNPTFEDSVSDNSNRKGSDSRNKLPSPSFHPVRGGLSPIN